MRKARKEKRCQLCGRVIHKGELFDYVPLAFASGRLCVDCCRIYHDSIEKTLISRNKPELLSDEEIGDLLDLEKEYTYPCSDGSKMMTIDCRQVAQAQREKDIEFYGGK